MLLTERYLNELEMKSGSLLRRVCTGGGMAMVRTLAMFQIAEGSALI